MNKLASVQIVDSLDTHFDVLVLSSHDYHTIVSKIYDSRPTGKPSPVPKTCRSTCFTPWDSTATLSWT